MVVTTTHTVILGNFYSTKFYQEKLIKDVFCLKTNLWLTYYVTQGLLITYDITPGVLKLNATMK